MRAAHGRCAAGLLVALCLLTGQSPAAAQNALPDVPGATVTDAAASDQPPLQPCPAPATAAGAAQLPSTPPGMANIIRERVRHRLGGTITSVCRMPFGLFEVVVDSEVLYVDERVNYLLAGNAFDLRTKENLTETRKEDVTRIDFKTLPLQNAVKTVRGNGSRVLAVFEDPNCPYCKRFEHDIASLDNTTIYTFLYPILSRDPKAPDDSYPKSRAIWCAPDRTVAWAQLMLEGRRLAPAADDCKNPIEDNLAFGKKLNITGTPTLVFTDGRRAPGAIPLEDVEKRIVAAGPYAAPATAGPAGPPAAPAPVR